jgi:hypothetical protein
LISSSSFSANSGVPTRFGSYGTTKAMATWPFKLSVYITLDELDPARASPSLLAPLWRAVGAADPGATRC